MKIAGRSLIHRLMWKIMMNSIDFVHLSLIACVDYSTFLFEKINLCCNLG